MPNLSAGKLLLTFCLCCVKYRLNHNSKPQHFVSLYCAFHVTNSTICVRSKAK